MRKFSTKRVLGVALASALALTGTVALAGSSQAAAAAAKASPTTGNAAGGTIVTLSGKNFQNDAGTSQINTIRFQATVCTDTPGGTTVSTYSVLSATKVVLTTPALAAGKWYLCVYKTASSLSHTTTFTTYTAPTFVAVSATSGPTFGGTKITITADDLTTKSVAKIDGKAIVGAKVVVNSGATDDTITGTVPAGSGTDTTVSITNEAGTVNWTGVGNNFDYVNALKVSPVAGTGADNTPIQVTGSGFDDFVAADFDTAAAGAASKVTIALIPAGATIADTTDLSGGLPTGSVGCDTVQVESDTSLSCQFKGAVPDGAYTLALLSLNASQEVIGDESTGYSQGATYTSADF